MKFLKNKIFLGLLISLVGIVLGYVFLYPVQFNLCTADFATLTFDNSCLRHSSLIGTKLFYFSLALAVVFLVLFFIPRAVRAWRKFAIWYIPIIGFFIATAPPEMSGGGFGITGNIGPSFQTQVLWANAIYVLISLIIIVRAWWKSRKNGL